MRNTLVLLTIITLTACSSKTGEQENSSTGFKSAMVFDQAEIPTHPIDNTSSSDPILGERIDGPANIRDTINGKLLFTLYDHTLVTCTALKNDWHTIGLLMDIDISEFGIDEIKKDRKIIVDGKEVGEIKSDMTVYTRADDKQAWAYLIGYTHKDNIKPFSIIE